MGNEPSSPQARWLSAYHFFVSWSKKAIYWDLLIKHRFFFWARCRFSLTIRRGFDFTRFRRFSASSNLTLARSWSSTSTRSRNCNMRRLCASFVIRPSTRKKKEPGTRGKGSGDGPGSSQSTCIRPRLLPPPSPQSFADGAKRQLVPPLVDRNAALFSIFLDVPLT